MKLLEIKYGKKSGGCISDIIKKDFKDWTRSLHQNGLLIKIKNRV